MNKQKKLSLTHLIVLITLASTYTIFHNVRAAETEVFVDGFETGIANWSLETGWSVVSENGNNVLQGTQHNFATSYLDGVADKLEFKLKLLNGYIHVNMRSSPAPGGLNRYLIGFNKDISYIGKQLGDNFQDLESGPGVSLNVWHDVKIEVIGDWIFVYVDDVLVVSFQDEDVLEDGGVSFETLEDSKANIDDVRIAQQFEQEILKTSISCNLSHTSISLNDQVFIIGQLSPPIESAKVELIIIAPDGTTTSELKTTAFDGSFNVVVNADQSGTWNFQTIWDGDEEYEGATSHVESLIVEEKLRRGIPGFHVESISLGLIIGIYAFCKLQSTKEITKRINKQIERPHFLPT